MKWNTIGAKFVSTFLILKLYLIKKLLNANILKLNIFTGKLDFQYCIKKTSLTDMGVFNAALNLLYFWYDGF